MTKDAERIYNVAALGLLYAYLLIPAWGYLIFLDALPKIRLTFVFGVLLIPVLMLRFWLLVTKKRPLPDRRYALLWGLLLWVTILQIAWSPNILSRLDTSTYLSGIAFSVGAYVFVLGSELMAFYISTHDAKSRVIWTGLVIIYVGFILMIAYGVARHFFNFHQLVFLFVLHNPKRIYNYQVLSDTFAIISLLMMARYGATGLFQRLAIYGISALFLFLAYSRSSVAAFLLAGGILAVIQTWRSGRRQKMLFGFAAGAALLSGVVVIIVLAKDAEDAGLSLLVQRFFSISTFRTSSFQERFQYWNQSLPLLKDYWLKGRFLYEAVLFEKGAYIHNWMSFWLAYGILPFLLSLGLLFWALTTAFVQRFSNPWAPLTCGLLLYNLIMIVTARPYIWVYFWFTLALSMALLRFNDQNDHERHSLSTTLE